MRKAILAVVVVLVMVVFPIVAFCFNLPSPTGYVNDFAEIIPAENRNQLEQKLRDYERQTAIEIAVVTTPSLDGITIEQWTIELVEKPGWGVGKKGKDNGIVIAVAPNERKYRIEVGYGLEGELPDSLAGSLGREHLVPFFKKGDYAGGIEKLVGGIMGALGTYTQAERIKIREQKAQAALQEAEQRRQRDEKVKALLGTAVAYLVIFAVLGGIVFGIILAFRKISQALKEAKRKETLRVEISSDIEMHLEKAELLLGKAREAKKLGINFPEWASNDLEKFILSAMQKIELARKECDSISEISRNDPDKAKVALESIKNLLKAAEDYIRKSESIPSKIESYKNKASREINDAETELSKAETDVKNAVAEGFRIDEISKGLKEKAESLSDLKAEWSTGDEKEKYLKGLDFFNDAEAIIKGIQMIADKLNLITRTKKSVDDNLKVFPAKSAKVEQLIGKCQDTLVKIKKNYPEENWRDIEEKFFAVPKALSEAEKLFLSAKEKNSMATQKFFEAEKDMANSMNLVDSSEMSIGKVYQRQSEIGAAKSFFDDNLENVAMNVEAAAKKVKDGDVGSKAKKISREAEEKLESVRIYSGNGKIINWILAAATIGFISELAASAVKIANSDIGDAEEERRRERRRREESSRSSYSSSNYSSSSSSSSFGGGGFGGGGASGSW